MCGEAGNVRGCQDLDAGLQVSTCTELVCATLVNTHTHRQLLAGYTVSSASWKKTRHTRLKCKAEKNISSPIRRYTLHWGYYAHYIWKQYCLWVKDRPPANNIHGNAFLLLGPWPWPDDLSIRTWPSYSADVAELYRLRLSKVGASQTDRHVQLKTLARRIRGWRKWEL